MTDNGKTTWDPFAVRTDGDIGFLPEPNVVWEFTDEGGFAWVFYADGNDHLTRPVILSDGFHAGPTILHDATYNMEGDDYAFLSALREEGYDLIILGYDDCTASILDNANVAIACINKAIEERQGDAKLTVGGFSMGGLITRYALAKMDHENQDHQTGTYVSYDSPHHGAWLPISMQAFAHAVSTLPVPDADAFSKLVNSPAAKQLLRYHISSWRDDTEAHGDREDFLKELDRVGSWPTREVRRIGVANGSGHGTPNGVLPGREALTSNTVISPTTLYTQEDGPDKLVANMPPREKKSTDNIPTLDGAPGGMMPFFELAADNLQENGIPAVAHHPWTGFVPSLSAMAAKVDNPWEEDSLYLDLSKAESELDEFKFSSVNVRHTAVTEELGRWIIDQLEST